MQRMSFGGPPAKGPRAVGLIGGLFVMAGLCWWLWPREDAPSTPPADLSAKAGGAGKPDPDPRPKQPTTSGSPADPAKAGTQEAKAEPADPLEAARRRIAGLRKAGNDDALRRALGALALDPRVERNERVALLAEADKLNDRLVWSSTPGPKFLSVKVEPGDSYWRIARRLWKQKKTTATAGMIRAINQVAPNRLRAGQSLKVPTEAVSLLVDKSDYTLYVLLGGAYVRRYPIGVGKGGSTPEGSFVIKGKTPKPTWRDPKTGKRYRYGEPGHLIGSRWLGFETPDGASTGYGIHGTIEPDTIGKDASEGCVRLVNAHVEALFELVPEGAAVTVRQ